LRNYPHRKIFIKAEIGFSVMVCNFFVLVNIVGLRKYQFMKAETHLHAVFKVANAYRKHMYDAILKRDLCNIDFTKDLPQTCPFGADCA
jgi:hypothetical protein